MLPVFLLLLPTAAQVNSIQVAKEEKKKLRSKTRVAQSVTSPEKQPQKHTPDVATHTRSSAAIRRLPGARNQKPHRLSPAQ